MVRKLIQICLLLSIIGIMSSCSEIKPMTLPPYSPPDLSSISRPTIEPLIEGQDYVIDEQANKVTLTVSGLNKITAKVISEQTAWQMIEMMKQTVQIQGELIKQKDQLLIAVDLQRQYAEKQKTFSTFKEYSAYAIALIITILILVK